jgi:hypothetical protein
MTARIDEWAVLTEAIRGGFQKIVVFAKNRKAGQGAYSWKRYYSFNLK